MKILVSKKGSQEVTIEKRDGCVVIRAKEVKTHMSKSVTVFDELLPGLIAQLSAIAITRSPTLREADGDTCPDCKGKGIVKDGFSALFECARCKGSGHV